MNRLNRNFSILTGWKDVPNEINIDVKVLDKQITLIERQYNLVVNIVISNRLLKIISESSMTWALETLNLKRLLEEAQILMISCKVKTVWKDIKHQIIELPK